MNYWAELLIVEKDFDTGRGHIVFLFTNGTDKFVLDEFISGSQADTWLQDITTPILASLNGLDPYLDRLRTMIGPINSTKIE